MAVSTQPSSPPPLPDEVWKAPYVVLVGLRILGLRRDDLPVVTELHGHPFYRILMRAQVYLAVIFAIGVAAMIASPVDWGKGLGMFADLLAFMAGLISILILRVGASIQLRVNREVQKVAATTAGSTQIYDEVERQEMLENRLFQRNLNDTFKLRALSWQGLPFLDDGEYRFAPRVNVLLGKNGYGKTLLFRSLATLIQRDREQAKQLFGNDTGARLTLEVARNGQNENVELERIYFRDGTGKIPLLAIPDSRFVNRSVQTLSSSPLGSEPLSSSGAKHFLTQQPFENVVISLLTQLVADYLTPKSGGFDQPLFHLIEDVVRELTGDDEFAFASIDRIPNTNGYRIMVRTQGNKRAPLPIQSASQGTLSIVAIFGLIYSFLHSLRPSAGRDEVLKIPGIVIVDEVDAHLHPGWQQKLVDVLSRRFPNVQFLISAHSPVVVAGRDAGEVSVLRKTENGGFGVKTIDEDFMGAKPGDLYKQLFEIEDAGGLYLSYSVKAVKPNEEEQRERERLMDKKTRSAAEEERLTELLREERLVSRAAEAREARLADAGAQAKVIKLEREVRSLKSQLAEKTAKLETFDRGEGHVAS